MNGRLAVLALALTSCGTPTRTEVMVVVQSNLSAQLKSVKLLVVRPADAGPLFESSCLCIGDAPCSPLPLTLGLVPQGSASAPFRVVARGYSDAACGAPLVEQTATLSFLAAHTLQLDLTLLDVCSGVTCTPGTTCVDAGMACVDDHRSTLPEYTGPGAGPGTGTPVAPSKRYHTAAAYDDARSRTVMMGGDSPNDDTATYEWDGSVWVKGADGGLPELERHSLVYDSTRKQVLLVGGWTTAGIRLANTYAWDGSAWNVIATAAPKRVNAAAVYDSVRQRVLLFGGFEVDANLGETWELKGTTWKQVSSTGPSPRRMHTMAYDELRDRVVLFGGQDDNGSDLADAWEWDGSQWQMVAGSPPARHAAGMVWDATHHVTLLFGGDVDDTWSWDGATWKLLNANGPHLRAHFGMAWDRMRSVAVLFGGYSEGQQKDDTWEFDGTYWTKRAP
jgi:Galactose oxidase, central domain